MSGGAAHTDETAVDAVSPLVGIGACLLGSKVRYNGEGKRRNPHIDALQDHIEFKSFCPEVAIGLGVPREPIRLVGELDTLRVTDCATQSKDYTAPLRSYAQQVLHEWPMLAGYVLVKGSPSCGYQRVRRYADDSRFLASDSTGMFAAALLESEPLLPVEEDGRMHDLVLRENFVTRLFAYHDLKQLAASGPDHAAMLAFWARYKYLVMAHHVPSYRELGQMLAQRIEGDIGLYLQEFTTLLMSALARHATRRSRTNVLQHIKGYLKRDLGREDSQALDKLIEKYRLGTVPIVVPLTLLRHFFARYRHAYIDQQVFLMPYPEQLGLHNDI